MIDVYYEIDSWNRKQSGKLVIFHFTLKHTHTHKHITESIFHVTSLNIVFSFYETALLLAIKYFWRIVKPYHCSPFWKRKSLQCTLRAAVNSPEWFFRRYSPSFIPRCVCFDEWRVKPVDHIEIYLQIFQWRQKFHLNEKNSALWSIWWSNVDRFFIHRW